jgi:hypothetical protein
MEPFLSIHIVHVLVFTHTKYPSEKEEKIEFFVFVGFPKEFIKNVKDLSANLNTYFFAYTPWE